MSQPHSFVKFAFLVLLVVLVVAPGAWASEDAVDSSTEPSVITVTADDVSLTGRSEPNADGPVAGVENPEPTPATSPTWQLYGRENCYDMFEQSCYQSYFPNPFCPSNPAGKACSPYGAICWVIINQWWADEYHCQN